MSKGGQGVKNQFKGLNLLSSPEPLKQLCWVSDSFYDKNAIKTYIGQAMLNAMELVNMLMQNKKLTNK